MKSPLCSACLNSDFLCNECISKIKNGEISEKSVEILKFLRNLSQKHASLREIIINDVIFSNNSALLITRNSDIPKIVGKQGNIVRQISNFVGIPVKIISNESFENLASTLIHPGKIKRISTVFSSEGERKRIVIDEKDKVKVFLAPGDIENLIEEISGEKMEVVFG